MRSNYAIVLPLIVATTPLYAQQAQETRPVLSERYTVSGPVEAVQEATARSEMANDEQLERFSKHEGPFDTFVRSDPVLQNVTWEYGHCTDIFSLLPPPMENWGLRSETLVVHKPQIDETRIEVSYVTFGAPDSDEPPAEKSVTIEISADQAQVEALAKIFNDPGLRPVLLTEGPYGYPIQPYAATSTMLGNYIVNVTGTGEDNAALYFRQMLRCAIENGLIADGVDPATLRNEP